MALEPEGSRLEVKPIRTAQTFLQPDFYNVGAADLARNLLGKVFVTNIGGKRTSGMIVDTEAYTGPDDAFSSSYRAPKVQSVVWQPGSIYVYSIQGHTMLTVAAWPFKDGATVLIRALQPLDGQEIMKSRHGEVQPKSLTSGPGVLSKSLGITTDLNGFNIFANRETLPPVTIEDAPPIGNIIVMTTERKGKPGQDPRRLRFRIAGNTFAKA